MDSIKKYSEQPVVIGIIAFVVGTIFGLVILGWLIWPVQWTDASPADLTHDYQIEYMRMSIDSFAVNGDAALANSRFNSLGEDANQVLAEIELNPAGQSTEVIAAYKVVVGADTSQLPPPEAGTAVPTQVPGAEEEGGINWGTVLLFFCILGGLLLLVGAAVYFYFSRRPTREKAAPITPEAPAVVSESELQEEAVPVEPEAEAPPIVQFTTRYKLGDDLYDDSFSIDSTVGEFLGECGVGVSETIGVGDTQKVTAFEIWLFDKNDIQTVTKVLMSAHAFRDEALRQKLAAKGEPVMVTSGSSTILETQTLYMMARVLDMSYGDGAMPPESYFDRFVLELSIWSK